MVKGVVVKFIYKLEVIQSYLLPYKVMGEFVIEELVLVYLASLYRKVL